MPAAIRPIAACLYALVLPLSGPTEGVPRSLSGQVVDTKGGMLARLTDESTRRGRTSAAGVDAVSGAGFVARLLVRGALRPGDRLEAPFGDRLAAVDGYAVGALVDAPLGALDRDEVVLEALDQRLVTLVLEELGSLVGGVLVDPRELVVPVAARASQRTQLG